MTVLPDLTLLPEAPTATGRRCVKCGGNDWYQSQRSRQCKVCKRRNAREYRAANKPQIAAQKHEYYAANKPQIASRVCAYYVANKEQITAQKREHYAVNKAKYNVRARKRYAANKAKIAAQQHEYYAANKEKIIARARKRYAANKTQIAAQQSKRNAATRGPQQTYLIKAVGTSLVKIGTSCRPTVRLSNLQVGSHAPLVLLGCVPETESVLHGRFSAYHSHGEWFREEGDLAVWLKTIEGDHDRAA